MDEQQLLCMSANPQELVTVALAKRNINYFRKALAQHGVDPEQNDQEQGIISIFEKCCQSPGHGEYITACMQWGCDPNKVNTNIGKSAINFVVESEDVKNLDALLEYPGVDINHSVDTLTPLHQLITKLTDDSFDRLFPCICRLIDHEADVNIANERSMTPVLTVANNRKLNDSHKLDVIEYILNNASVDLDLHRDGQARSTLEKKFPEIELPPVISEKDRKWDLDRLFDVLRNENEDLFRIGFPQFKNDRSDLELKEDFAKRLNGRTLLTMAVSNRLNRAVQLLLRAGADVHDYQTTHTDNEIGPIRTACINGQYAILQMLLRSTGVDINRSPVLIDVIKHIGQPIPKAFANSSDYNRCFDLLINDKNIDLNLKDSFGNTALYTAVIYKNKRAIEELLNRGVFIGAKNTFNRIAIEDIDTRLLKSHLDRCIQQNNRRSGDDNYELQFDFKNFVPAEYNTRPVPTPTLWSSNKYDEMIPIEYLAKSNDHKHLVKHPLIASFLDLKWQRFAPVFYFNFTIFLIFSLAMVPYIHLYYGKPDSSAIRTAFFIVSLVTLVYVIIREMIQFIMSPGQYLQKIENILEVALIVMSALVLSGFRFNDEWQRTIAATTILLVVGELFILTGSLPVLSFTTHLVMLRTVTKTFLRSLMLYSIMLVAFALCFHTLLSKNEKKEDETLAPKVEIEKEEEEGEVDFNGFSNLYIALVKTVVMLTGEFDASDIKFQSMLPSYIIFVIFVFLFSSVLVNLLNGLAISDTQLIKSEAEITHFVYRSEMLAKYEKISLGSGIHPFFNVVFYKFFFGKMCLFPDYLPAHSIAVLPNQNNQVHITPGPAMREPPAIGQTEDGSLLTKPSTQDIEHGCFARLRQFSRMEPKIVKYARAMLEQRASDEEDDTGVGAGRREDEMDRRMRHMEETIDLICRNVERIAAKLDVSLQDC